MGELQHTRPVIMEFVKRFHMAGFAVHIHAIGDMPIRTAVDAIEAARAGEFGKGFVVVSTDIRNLARDSAENADRIKDLVKAVQDQIGAVGRDLVEIAAVSAGEIEKAKASTANLITIEEDVSVIEKGGA